jgi:hypothetical protein
MFELMPSWRGLPKTIAFRISRGEEKTINETKKSQKYLFFRTGTPKIKRLEMTNTGAMKRPGPFVRYASPLAAPAHIQ